MKNENLLKLDTFMKKPNLLKRGGFNKSSFIDALQESNKEEEKKEAENQSQTCKFATVFEEKTSLNVRHRRGRHSICPSVKNSCCSSQTFEAYSESWNKKKNQDRECYQAKGLNTKFLVQILSNPKKNISNQLNIFDSKCQ